MAADTVRDADRDRFPTAHGPVAVEAALLAELDRLLAAAERDLSLLARPVLVVVPSHSLRDHLLARIAAQRGRAAAGLAVLTLFGLARETLRRAGAAATPGTLPFEVLVRRAARDEAALSTALGGLDDGFASAVATIRDLLDAGLTEAHRPAVEERLEDLSRSPAMAAHAARAAALARAAVRVEAVLERLGTPRTGSLYTRAAELLNRSAGALLPARAVLVHGFADATGVASDLLEALVRRCGARVFVDRPPDAAAPDRVDAGAAFSERFLASLGWLSPGGQSVSGGRPAELERFCAPGAHAEAREVARRVRALLDRGAAAERVGVVARDLSPYAVPLRVHLRRLGVPFSGVDVVAPPGPARRRLGAVVELLEEGGACPADRWLDAVVALDGGGGAQRSDTSLRLALRALGAARLADVAGLDLDAAGVGRAFRLPIRSGADEEGERVDGPPPRRTVHREVLETAGLAAARLAAMLDGWPPSAPARAHLRRLNEVLVLHLGWRPDEAAARPAFEAVATLAAGLVGELPLTREELALLLRRALDARSADPLGGEGGGVQVMTVTAARGRTFDHLFVLGLNRDRFPRQVSEDPLLPDALRRALRDLLPALPLKGEGHVEERYLFAQLLAAAAHVTLSWMSTDDDGAEQSPSPLVERLRLAAGGEGAPAAPALLAPPGPDSGPLPAHEHALHAALSGARRAFEASLAVAGREAGWEQGAATARIAALAELGGHGRAATLGPYLGLVGPRPGGEAWVTTLERLAGCPWRAFLAGELGVEAPPDPLAAPAGIAPALLGTLVHEVLRGVVADVAGPAGSLGAALAREPVEVPRPGPDKLRRRLSGDARRLAHAEGVPHLAAALAARAEPFVALACRLLWADGPLLALGAEVTGETTVAAPDGPVTIRFRADLVERRGDRTVLTDFKTGSPLSAAKQERTRAAHLLKAVKRGEALQAAAYARGAGGAAAGRYLYLKHPEREAPAREFAVVADDVEVQAAFEDAVETTLAARAAGARFPRLLKPDLETTFERCDGCEVREACLQPDSGTRRRLARWVERLRGGAVADSAEAAAFAVWRLRERDEGET